MQEEIERKDLNSDCTELFVNYIVYTIFCWMTLKSYRCDLFEGRYKKIYFYTFIYLSLKYLFD